MFPITPDLLTLGLSSRAMVVAGGAAARDVMGRGGPWRWTLCGGLRPAVEAAGGAASSRVLSRAASPGSAALAVPHDVAAGRSCRRSSARGGLEPYCKRVGGRLAPLSPTHSSTPAPDIPSCFVSHALDRRYALQCWLQWVSFSTMPRSCAGLATTMWGQVFILTNMSVTCKLLRHLKK